MLHLASNHVKSRVKKWPDEWEMANNYAGEWKFHHMGRSLGTEGLIVKERLQAMDCSGMHLHGRLCKPKTNEE
jgi:hypothetical protein